MDQASTTTGNTKLSGEDYVTQPLESILIAWNRFYNSNLYTVVKLGIIGVAAFVLASLLVVIIVGGILNAALSDSGGLSSLNTPTWSDAQMSALSGSLAGAIAITVAIYTLALTPVAIAIDYAAVRSQNKQLTTVSSSLDRGIKRFLVAIGTYILAFLAILAGLILLIIPGVYIALRLSYLNGVIANENNGPISNLKRSWELTKGNLWDIVGVLSSVTVASSLVSIVFGPMIDALINNNGNDILVAIISLVMAAASIILGFVSVISGLFRYHQSDLQKQSQLTKTHTDKLNYLALAAAVIAVGVDNSVNQYNRN